MYSKEEEESLIFTASVLITVCVVGVQGAIGSSRRSSAVPPTSDETTSYDLAAKDVNK